MYHIQINVIANAYFIDVFLGGEFSTYGLEVLKFLDYPADKVRILDNEEMAILNAVTAYLSVRSLVTERTHHS